MSTPTTTATPGTTAKPAAKTATKRTTPSSKGLPTRTVTQKGAPDVQPTRTTARPASAKTTATKKASPKATAKPTTQSGPDKQASRKRDAKQALARLVLNAVATAVMDVEKAQTPDAMLIRDELGTGETMAAVAAFWVHHLPTGKSEPGSAEAKRHARWWPTSLPIPARSDWR